MGKDYSIYRSEDSGATWEKLWSPMDGMPICSIAIDPQDTDTIFRGIKPDDSNVNLSAVGDTANGSTGAVQRSQNGGETWETRPLPVDPNSNIWNIVTNPADPDFVLASSLLGEVYSSNAEGDSWLKLKREFSEVGAMVWVPN